MEPLGRPRARMETARIQYPNLDGKILIIEDQDVDALVMLLQNIEDVHKKPIDAVVFDVTKEERKRRGIGNIVEIMGIIAREDVRLILSDHNLELKGPDGQPVMGALFLKQIYDVLGRQAPAEYIGLAAYTGWADKIRDKYGSFLGAIPVIEKGGAHDIVTWCAATLSIINDVRRRYATDRTATPSQVPELAQQQYTLERAVDEAAKDIRGNAGVTTMEGLQPIPNERFTVSYRGDIGIDWEKVAGERSNGSVLKVISALTSFFEHSARPRPHFTLDLRPADSSCDYDLGQVLGAPTAAKWTLRISRQVAGTDEYVKAIVRPMFERSFPTGRLYAERAQGSTYVMQLFIPDALAR